MTDVLDWDDLSDEDKQRAQELLHELNNLFSKYEKEEPECEKPTLKD